MTQKRDSSAHITTTKDHAAWMPSRTFNCPGKAYFVVDTQPGKAWDMVDLLSVEHSFKLMTSTYKWRK